MTKVFKYNLDFGTQEISLSRGAKVLTAAMQYGKPTIWALVDPDISLGKIRFSIVGTEMPVEQSYFVATFFDGPFVWHIFADEDCRMK